MYIHTYAVSDVLVGTSFDPMTFKALPPQQVASVLAEEEAKLADLDNERERKVCVFVCMYLLCVCVCRMCVCMYVCMYRKPSWQTSMMRLKERCACMPCTYDLYVSTYLCTYDLYSYVCMCVCMYRKPSWQTSIMSVKRRCECISYTLVILCIQLLRAGRRKHT